MKKAQVLFCFTLIYFISNSQLEYTPSGFGKAGYRILTINSIHNDTAYFNYCVWDSVNSIGLNGEISKSKITFYRAENKGTGESEMIQKIIQEINSKKSRLYFNMLVINLEKYPDSLANTEMFNNYFKPLTGLNFTQLAAFYFNAFSSWKESQLDTIYFDYRNVSNFAFAEKFEYALIENMQHHKSFDIRQKVQLSKIDFIQQIDFKNLEVYKCGVPFFDSEKLVPLLRSCKDVGLTEYELLNNRNIELLDSIQVYMWTANTEFWNNSSKLRSYRELSFYDDTENDYWYLDAYDFPINYFFNSHLTPLKKMEWFNTHYFIDAENYSGDYYVRCYNCKLETAEESMDTLLVKGKIENGKPVGSWFVRENMNAPFVILNFDEDYVKPVFPQDGSWSFNYPNGQTAIKGDFKAGKKTDKWYFYDFDGKLLMVKSFKEDLLNGLSQYYSVDGKRELQLYLHSNGDFVSCLRTYSYINGERILDGKTFTCFYTNEKGTTNYNFTEGFDNDGYLLEIVYPEGIDRTIDRNTKEYEEIKNNYFLKYLEVK